MSKPTTPLRELVQERLGRTDLLEWVQKRKDEGESMTSIARSLSARTDVYVNRETLRRWIVAETTDPTEAAA